MTAGGFIPNSVGLKQKDYVSWFGLWKDWWPQGSLLQLQLTHLSQAPLCPHYPLPDSARQNLGWLPAHHFRHHFSYLFRPNTTIRHSEAIPVATLTKYCLWPGLARNRFCYDLVHICHSWPLPKIADLCLHSFWRGDLFTQARKWGPLAPSHHCYCQAIIYPLKKPPPLKLLPSRWAMPAVHTPPCHCHLSIS